MAVERARGGWPGEGGAQVRIQHPLFAGKCEAWEWCLHCEKAAAVSDWQGNDWCCASCGAGAMDMWAWSEVRAVNRSYPASPVPGVVYPLYGQKASKV